MSRMTTMTEKEAEVHGENMKNEDNVPELASVLASGNMASSGRAFRFPNDRVLRMLAVQALLLQLREPKVRNDFCAGKVLPKHSLQHLKQLDLLCAACLPQWLLGVGFADQLQQSSENLDKLITQSTSVLVVKSKTCTYSKSYNDWFSIIYKLAHSLYWSNMSDQDDTAEPQCIQVDSFSFKEADSVGSPSVPTPNPAREETPQVNLMGIVSETTDLSDVHPNNKICNTSNAIQYSDDQQNLQEVGRGSNKLKSEECCGTHRSEGSKCTQRYISLKNVKPERNSRMISTRSLQQFVPLCSGCGGDHLGIVCWRRKQFCHWCGKIGHSEEACWRKAGACLICGSADHHLRQCSRYVHLYAPVFPPWCMKCGSTHLGEDCADPYME